MKSAASLFPKLKEKYINILCDNSDMKLVIHLEFSPFNRNLQINRVETLKDHKEERFGKWKTLLNNFSKFATLTCCSRKKLFRLFACVSKLTRRVVSVSTLFEFQWPHWTSLIESVSNANCLIFLLLLNAAMNSKTFFVKWYTHDTVSIQFQVKI